MILEVVNQLMAGLNLPYAYWEYPGAAPDLYYVGELIEQPTDSEDGRREGQVVLSGWSHEGLSALLDAAEAIRRQTCAPLHFKGTEGAVVLEYSYTVDVPCDVDGVYRKETYIDYKEWSVG